jgi:hypothetical protein
MRAKVRKKKETTFEFHLQALQMVKLLFKIKGMA